MYSKFVLIFLLLISLSSCSWWGGDVRDNSTVKIEGTEVLGDSTDCIDEVSSFFSNYFSGTTTNVDIQRNFSCVTKTVDIIFENATEKNTETGFRRSEIMQILTTIFPKKDKTFLNDNIEILFLVKRIFVGGLEDGFSRKDHVNLKEALPKVKVEFTDSKSHIKHLFFGRGLSFDERNEGFKKLRQSFRKLDEVKSQYGGVITAGEGTSIVSQIFKKDSLVRFREFAFIAKTFVYNDDPKVFKISQKDFFERMIRIFEIQARIRALDFQKGFLFGKAYYDLESAVLLTAESFLKWAGADKNWHIKVESFGRILKAGQVARFWEDRFSDTDLVNSSIQKMIIKIFETDKLDFISMHKLDRILRGWVNRQENLISSYDFEWILEKKKVKISTESQNLVDEIESFKFPQFLSENNSPITIQRNAGSLVPAKVYFDQSLKHLLVTAANEVFKAYSSVQPFKRRSPKRRMNLQLEDLKNIFKDIRPLGLEFGFNDPHNCGSEGRVLLEADSLTLSGNGDGYVSVTEASEWLGTMISVASASSRIFEKIENLCALPGMKIQGASFLDRSCALKQLTSNDSILKNHFPDTFHYAHMLRSDNRREEFEDKLGGLVYWLDDIDYEEADHKSFHTSVYNSLNSCSENKNFPFSKKELSVSIAVNAYVENLYHQFDTSGVTPWSFTGAEDPPGADFIIDGGELSEFFRTKVSGALDLMVPLYKEKHWASRHLPDVAIKTLLKNLPESSNYLDRARGLQLIKKFLGSTEPEKRHPFANKFCDDVGKTQSTFIQYRKEDRLMCLPSDMNFF